MGQNPNRTPSEHPNGWFTYPKMVPLVLNHGHMAPNPTPKPVVFFLGHWKAGSLLERVLNKGSPFGAGWRGLGVEVFHHEGCFDKDPILILFFGW